MVDNQNGTRNLTPVDRIELALVKRDAVERRGRERMSLGGKGGVEGVQNSAPLEESGKVRDILAADAGCSHDTIDRAAWQAERAAIRDAGNAKRADAAANQERDERGDFVCWR